MPAAIEPSSTLTRAQAVELLRVHRIMPTQQRVEIAVSLLGEPQHVCADTLLERINRGGGGVSKATVYNTLRLFASRGLLREVIVEPTKTFYDSNTRRHHHFYDAGRGELIDIGCGEITIGRLPAPPTGTRIDDVEVVVRVSSVKKR